MAEWLYEAGIGEARAALIEHGAIVEASIEHDEVGPRAGAIIAARLGPPIPPAAALARLEDGGEALLNPVPRGLGEGAALLVEIVREAIPERGNPKLAHARPAAEGAVAQLGLSLRERIGATGLRVRTLTAVDADLLERAGWSELLEEARTGLIAFPGGTLRMALTPAMTLFDVDGVLPPAELARAGAAAAARAVRRMAIAGSIGIDLPSVGGKADRQSAAAAFDAGLPQPFERTAVNGFGFLQIIRRRTRPSLPELLRADPAGAAARAVLRLAERTPGAGIRTLVAAPAVIERIEARPHWLDQLSHGLGAPVRLQVRAELPISAGHVAVEHP